MSPSVSPPQTTSHEPPSSTRRPPSHPLLSRRLTPSSPLGRVCYIFGGLVKAPLTAVTPTFLTSGVLAQIREADYVAHQVREDAERGFREGIGGIIHGMWLSLI